MFVELSNLNKKDQYQQNNPNCWKLRPYFTALVSATKHIPIPVYPSLHLQELPKSSPTPQFHLCYISCFCCLHSPCICPKHFWISHFHDFYIRNFLHCMRKSIPLVPMSHCHPSVWGEHLLSLNYLTKPSQFTVPTTYTSQTALVPSCAFSTPEKLFPPQHLLISCAWSISTLVPFCISSLLFFEAKYSN